MVLKKEVFIAFCTILAIILSPVSYSAVLINEILANGLNDPDSEWVELFNNESYAVNLTNWKISETSSSNFTFNATMPANGFVILAGDFGTFNSTYPNVNLSGIKIVNITISNFNLADSGGEARLYNSSGSLIDNVAYAQASGKAFENVSIGRYPDGTSNMFNLSTLTPGAKNDNQAPHVNKWLNPSRNNTKISALVNITVNITDDTTQVNSTIISFNNTNFSMAKNNGIWWFLWNTSLNIQKPYNITIIFNDTYGKSGSDALFNITVNNSPAVTSFSPSGLTQALVENSTLDFSVNASDPDDAVLNYSWLIDGTLNSTKPVNFSYKPGLSDNGTHTINATIKDASSNQVSIKWAVTVTNFNRAPVLDSISNKTASKNINLSFNITATDADGDALAFSSNHSGIAISKLNDSAAAISWKLTNKELGSNTINFTVSDGSLADSKIAIITVDFTGNTAPNITSAPKATATINEKYIYDADAVDSDNDTLVFSLKANASGISIDSQTGIIAFTPSSLGVVNVDVSVTDFIEITNQSYTITVKEGSKLKISDADVKIDGKKSSNTGNNTKISREAKPESGIEFKVKVKNDFSESDGIELKDIEVKITIEGIDNDDDLEEESNNFDLRAQDDKAVTLKFKLPLNVDEGTFDALIEAEGEDENGIVYNQHLRILLEVEKEKHDLRLLDFDLSPSMVNCNRLITINYKIINLGQENEENAVLEVKSNGIGLNFADNFSVDSGTEDNAFSKSIRLKLSDDIESGIYTITANAYSDDGKLRDARVAELRVEDCIKAGKAEEMETFLAGAEEQPEETEAVKEIVKAQVTRISFEEDGRMLLLLSNLMFTMFFVSVAIILFVRFY